jgi:sulfate transport system ATP-binding protein
MSLIIKNIGKNFNGSPILKNIDLKIETGECVALLGPSGSGKTTLLRIIAGLEFPDEGSVFINGFNSTHLSAYERKAGFVFQHYALFNHLNALENVAFGLRVKPKKERLPEKEILVKAKSLLARMQLEKWENHLPSQLSGGQKQRVALARALAVDPTLLLLDEPFGALDAKVKKELRKWFRTFHQESKLTSLFVTHDQEEAFELADRVVIIHEGVVQQIGTPGEIKVNPENDFVHDFLGLNI